VDEPDLIQLRGVRAMGIHGVLPEEQGRPQPFEVDLDLAVDLRAAGRSDRLEDTVDYGAVADAVAACITDEHLALLERLAERIATIALEDTRVTAVTVSLRKLQPPVAAEVGDIGVRIVRKRT
jgi:dihydroneopterin aldolase